MSVHDCHCTPNYQCVPCSIATSIIYKPTKEGVKFDGEKPRMDLLSPIALEELAKVLTYGAKKYDSWNWSKGIAYTRVLAASMRHLLAYMRGEDKDSETGLSHIGHLMCNCMFLLHFEKYRSEFDDREKAAYNKTVASATNLKE